jgi:hypothetical protein
MALMALSSSERLRCCFCGVVPDAADYIEIELHTEGSDAIQWLGAHRDHLAVRLAWGFAIELPE